MLTGLIYPIIILIVWGAFLIFFTLLLLRLIFSYADPNPFGRIGRMAFKIRKMTERFVYPAARLLANFRIDTRLAPVVVMLIGAFITYLAIQVIGNTLFIIDGLTDGIVSGSSRLIIGFILYGLLSVLVLFILIRFISSWFVFTRNTFLGFVKRVTDPILVPVQKLIPPIGVFDISGLVVLIFIQLLQMLVYSLFSLNVR